MCQGNSLPHLFAMISGVMEESSQMLIFTNNRDVANHMFSYNWHQSSAARTKETCFGSSNTRSTQRDQELSLPFAKVWQHGMLLQSIHQE